MRLTQFRKPSFSCLQNREEEVRFGQTFYEVKIKTNKATPDDGPVAQPVRAPAS